MKNQPPLEGPEAPSFQKNGHGAKGLWLVVIDHREARIFHSQIHGTASEDVRPDQTDEAITHAHSFNGFSRGQEKPAELTFFGPVADALEDAREILLFGSGTGTGNEMEQFGAWLKTHRPEVAQRIVGTVVIDAHHVTDAQLLAKAREFYGGLRVPRG